MQLDFLNVLFTVLFLVILVLPGYILVKMKMVGERADATLSTIVLYIAQPMLMLTSFQKQFDSKILINMLITAGLAIAVHGIMILFVIFVIRDKDSRASCAKATSVFANCGYMGLPFLSMLFGSNSGEVLIYAAMVIAVFNFFHWSIGIYLISGKKENINIKNALLNPTVIAIIVGLILFVAVQTPFVDLAPQNSTLDNVLEKFMKSLNYLAEMVTPLAMIVIGMKLAKVQFKNMIKEKYVYIACFNKLILMSIISILLVVFLPIDDTVKYAIFFCLSMPSATGNALFAVKFGGDGEMASVVVMLSTILSILTIPLMFLLFTVFV